MFDRTLSWKPQTHYARRKFLGSLHQLIRAREILTPDIRISLVKTLVFPHLDYCAALFTNLDDENTNRLQVTMNSVVRFICALKKWDHISDSYNRLNWLKYKERRTLLIITLAFSVLTLNR